LIIVLLENDYLTRTTFQIALASSICQDAASCGLSTSSICSIVAAVFWSITGSSLLLLPKSLRPDGDDLEGSARAETYATAVSPATGTVVVIPELVLAAVPSAPPQPQFGDSSAPYNVVNLTPYSVTTTTTRNADGSTTVRTTTTVTHADGSKTVTETTEVETAPSAMF